MSFAAELNLVLADVPTVEDVPKEEIKRRPKEEVRDELFKVLTDKYLLDVRESILRSAKKGLREKYINFKKDDFKANYPGLGTPAQFQNEWLKEMSNPGSKYMLTDDTGKKMTLEGITFDVMNNFKFTTVFKW